MSYCLILLGGNTLMITCCSFEKCANGYCGWVTVILW